MLVEGATDAPAPYQDILHPYVLWCLDTECFPVGRLEELVFAEEVFEALVTCETVALFLASVIEEVARVVEANAAIHAHAV